MTPNLCSSQESKETKKLQANKQLPLFVLFTASCLLGAALPQFPFHLQRRNRDPVHVVQPQTVAVLEQKKSLSVAWRAHPEPLHMAGWCLPGRRTHAHVFPICTALSYLERNWIPGTNGIHVHLAPSFAAPSAFLRKQSTLCLPAEWGPSKLGTAWLSVLY